MINSIVQSFICEGEEGKEGANIKGVLYLKTPGAMNKQAHCKGII